MIHIIFSNPLFSYLQKVSFLICGGQKPIYKDISNPKMKFSKRVSVQKREQ